MHSARAGGGILGCHGIEGLVTAWGQEVTKP